MNIAKHSRQTISSLRIAGLALAILTQAPVFAQPAPASSSDADSKKDALKLESFIVTGTRRLDRMASESMAPIDIISEERLAMSVSPELTDKLMMEVPSFNVQRLPLSETTSFIRPARLRNLSSDHTLVLINGKRQHRTAGVTSVGTQGVDLAQIPTSAIQRVEVLRDGASAQYGSDALAGVINIMLKRKTGYDGYLNLSEYFEGDGFLRQVGFDFGAALPNKGFINVALEYTKGDRTSRSIQRPDAIAAIAADPSLAAHIANPVQPWGQPDRETKRFMLNSEMHLSSLITAYAFGLYGEDKGTDDFNWRNPLTNGAFKRSIYQDAPYNIFPTFNLRSIYPGGFLPLFTGLSSDMTAAIGVKGSSSDSKLNWDVSVTTGRNVVDYVLDQTWNPSYGALSPSKFDVGGLRQRELTYNADFVYAWDTSLSARPVNVSFGVESRTEEFSIRAGERASWDIGPLADLGVGSNGYGGWTNTQAFTKKRTSNAAYVDFDFQLTDRVELGLAGRYEDYPDFGSTEDGKASIRVAVTPALAARATVSTGFHAPTPGISNYTRTNSGPAPGGQTILVNGSIGVTNPVAIYFGAKPLQPETSTNYSGGFVFTPSKALTVSLDAYVIEVNSRLFSSQDFPLTAALRDQLVASGIVDAQNMSSVRFFVNAFDTRTDGADLVASYKWDLANKDSLTLTGAVNYNHTKMLRANGALVSNETRINLERRLPRVAGNVSAEYTKGKYKLTGRVRYFGTVESADTATIHQEFSAQQLFDLFATWNVNKHLSITLGAENILNSYPDKALFNVAAGLKYSRFAPYDTDGGRYFTRVNFSF
jgi:iron complex outermembrane receptor protein